jgi:hypothetical protein
MTDLASYGVMASMNRLPDVVGDNGRADPGSMGGGDRIEFRRYRTWKAITPNKITQWAKNANGPIPRELIIANALLAALRGL